MLGEGYVLGERRDSRSVSSTKERVRQRQQVLPPSLAEDGGGVRTAAKGMRLMRELTSHKVNGLNESLRIEVRDEPGQGNACHEYAITYRDANGFDSSPISENHGRNCIISFQNGPIAEHGVNGISNEALLAIVEDRLLGFQSGPYACRENAVALTKIQEAMMWLQKRTLDRVRRGVEGTSAK